LPARAPRPILSALLFGGSFLIVPTAVTAFIRKAAPPEAWTRTIALFTTAFAIGQCLGPIASGRISDTAHGLGGGLLLSAGLLALAALSALAQREPGVSGLPATGNQGRVAAAAGGGFGQVSGRGCSPRLSSGTLQLSTRWSSLHFSPSRSLSVRGSSGPADAGCCARQRGTAMATNMDMMLSTCRKCARRIAELK
jgi:hypothetical protein